jgi:hypothetical protein
MRLLTENNEDEELSTLEDAKGDYISLRNHRFVRIDRSGSLEGLACDSVHGTGRDKKALSHSVDIGWIVIKSMAILDSRG